MRSTQPHPSHAAARLPPFWSGLEHFALRHFPKTAGALAVVTLVVMFSNITTHYPELSFWVGMPILVPGVASFVASPLWARLRQGLLRQQETLERKPRWERFLVLACVAVGLLAITVWTSLFGQLVLIAAWSLISHALFFWARRPKMLALKYGISTDGEVVSVERDTFGGGANHLLSRWRVTYTYRDGAGREREGVEVIEPPDGAPPAAGDAVEVMVDPTAPEVSALVIAAASEAEPGEGSGATATASVPAPDRRQPWSGPGEDEVRPPEAVEVALSSFDFDALAWWELGIPHDSTTLQLSLDDGRLRAAVHDQETLTELDLNEAFVAHLGFWPVSATEAELSVTLRPREGGVGGSPLRFVVPVAQDEVAPTVPLQRGHDLQMQHEDFAALWPALVFHGQLHGLRLERQVRLREEEVPEVFSGVSAFVRSEEEPVERPREPEAPPVEGPELVGAERVVVEVEEVVVARTVEVVE